MALYNGELIPWLEQRFLTADGTAPLSLGTLEFYEAGTSTPQASCTTANLDVDNATTLTLDAGGRPTTNLFLKNTGYKVIVKDSTGAVQYTMDLIENVGATFAQTLGNVLATGAKNVTSGYTVLATDRLVTVASTGGANPCIINLPSVATATQPVCVKNVGNIDTRVTPNGTDLIDNQNTYYTVPAVSGHVCAAILLMPDQTNATWWIEASHKV